MRGLKVEVYVYLTRILQSRLQSKLVCGSAGGWIFT